MFFELQLWQNSSQQNIALIGAITIRDDEGKIVSVRGVGGDSTVIYPNKEDSTGNKPDVASAPPKEASDVSDPPATDVTKKVAPVNVSNDITSASMDVLKRSAKLFGVAADQLRELRNLKPGPQNVNRGTRVNSGQSEDIFAANQFYIFTYNFGCSKIQLLEHLLFLHK